MQQGGGRNLPAYFLTNMDNIIFCNATPEQARKFLEKFSRFKTEQAYNCYSRPDLVITENKIRFFYPEYSKEYFDKLFEGTFEEYMEFARLHFIKLKLSK